MPSIAANARARGFEALRSTSGETLRFRGAELVTVVRRDVDQLAADGLVDFSERKASVIEVEFDELESRPINGELFTDKDDAKHRVRLVKTLDFSWICICEVEQ